MNHLQQAWLKVLAPVIPLVNDKLAKRSGLLVSLILWDPLSTNTTEKDPQEQREP